MMGTMSPADVTEPELADVRLADVMHALGDETRLEIVRILATQGECRCGTLELGVSKATRSHHLKVLREAGVTHTRAAGTSRHVSLRDVELAERFPGLLDAVLTAAPRG